MKLLIHPELAKLNIGILFLHAIFTASFIVIPISLYTNQGFASNTQWIIYLPTLLGAFIISLFCIGMAERKQQLKPFFLSGIALLAISELTLWLAPHSLMLIALALCLFFGGFSLLEAFLPSLISRTAPADRKGSALGIYSCAQFLGIFIGGSFGGLIYGHWNFAGVYLFCIILALAWLILAFLMQPPRYLVNQMWRLSAQQAEWDRIATHLQVIPGVVEITFVAEESMAYLKVERATLKHPDFIRLKEQLQSK